MKKWVMDEITRPPRLYNIRNKVERKQNIESNSIRLI